MKKLFILLSIPVFLFGCTNNNSSSEPVTNSGKVVAEAGLVYDFGDIDIQGGVVSKTFSFQNTDSKPLYIYEAVTSCGCTQGEITVSGKNYGPFGMQNLEMTPIVVPAESDFEVTINYDPLFHGPNDLGLRQRTLFLFTSAEYDGKPVRTYTGKPNFTEISVTGNVVKSTN